MESKDLATLLIKGIDAKKAMNIKLLYTEKLTTMADYFIIATATSNTHIKALSDAAEEAAEKNGVTVHHIEGRNSGTWVLLDFSSVIVHLFTKETRDFYNLERLWNDAEEIDISDIVIE